MQYSVITELDGCNTELVKGRCYRKKRLMSSSFAHVALIILLSSVSDCTMPETYQVLTADKHEHLKLHKLKLALLIMVNVV